MNPIFIVMSMACFVFAVLVPFEWAKLIALYCGWWYFKNSDY